MNSGSMDRVGELTRLLDCLGIEYMLVGSLAGNVWGLPRSTNDADLVAEMSTDAAARLVRSLPSDMKVEPQLSFETNTATQRLLEVKLPTRFKIEVFEVGDDPHHLERFARRVRVPIPDIGVAAWAATAEDMLVQKLRWGRRKDLDDALTYVMASGDVIDWPYVERWVAEHGTAEKLAEIRAEAEAIGQPED